MNNFEKLKKVKPLNNKYMKKTNALTFSKRDNNHCTKLDDFIFSSNLKYNENKNNKNIKNVIIKEIIIYK